MVELHHSMEWRLTFRPALMPDASRLEGLADKFHNSLSRLSNISFAKLIGHCFEYFLHHLAFGSL